MQTKQIIQGKDSVEKIHKITQKILKKQGPKSVKVLSYQMDFGAQKIKLGFSLN
jgi:hypothetical protein